jgi:hypothetical protein
MEEGLNHDKEKLRELQERFFFSDLNEVVSHKVCKAESYSEIFEPIKAQKNFGNNFLVT